MPMFVREFPLDVRVLDGGPGPVRHCQFDRRVDKREARPRELQIVFRYVFGDNRKEDLVALFYFLLAPAYISG
jgi:hypothetical protein